MKHSLRKLHLDNIATSRKSLSIFDGREIILSLSSSSPNAPYSPSIIVLLQYCNLNA